MDDLDLIMKRIFFCIMLAIAVFTVQAQGMDKGHHIEFYGGASFPIGDFGKPIFGSYYHENEKQATLNFHGAKIGASYGLVADFYVINDYLGILINVNASTHSLQALQPEEDTYPGRYFLPRNEKTKWTMSASGSWNSIQALLGITARYPIVDWMLFTGRAAIGYSHFVVPFFSAYATNTTKGYVSNTLTTPSKGGFGYLAGIGLQFCITSSVGIHLRSDYCGSSLIPFKGDKATVSETYDKNQELKEKITFEFRESLQTVNVNIGLSLAF
jgi:hypothetical protein